MLELDAAKQQFEPKGNEMLHKARLFMGSRQSFKKKVDENPIPRSIFIKFIKNYLHIIKIQ